MHIFNNLVPLHARIQFENSEKSRKYFSVVVEDGNDFDVQEFIQFITIS